MAQPPAFVRLEDYTDYETANPGNPPPSASLDAEFDALKVTTDAVRQNMALLQRDDGALANAKVTPDSLASATLALIASDWTPRGAWATATVYAVGDLVSNAGTSYVCATAHTSGTFATDLAADKWLALGAATFGQVTLTRDVAGTWRARNPDGGLISTSGSTTGGLQEAFDYARDNDYGLFVGKGAITATGTLTLDSLEHMTIRCDANITFDSSVQYGIVLDDFLHSFIEFTGVITFSGTNGAAIHVAPTTGSKNALDFYLYVQRILVEGGSGSDAFKVSPTGGAQCQRATYEFGEVEGGNGATAYADHLFHVVTPTAGGMWQGNRVKFRGPGLIWGTAALQIGDASAPTTLTRNRYEAHFETSANATNGIHTFETDGHYHCDIVSSATLTTGIREGANANRNVFEFAVNQATTKVVPAGGAYGSVFLGPPIRVVASNGSGDLTLTDATEAQVTFDTESVDAGGNFASSTFTAPYDCVVRIHAAARFLVDAAADCRLYIKINAGINAQSDRTIAANKNETLAVDYTFTLAQADTVKVYAFVSSAGATSRLVKAGGAQTRLEISLVGR
ncbi:MAG: hypothetical protein A3E78_12190 [Alphaproteobacteria bacterium RIFCSPHIGHO2_12_FULL_63_12]|nr:MAG: hypothetical protein A3E78_12190 [Alphaproteobacteria bacterium RIFCSPHIGHO2_12_FULL_63_12]